MKKRFYFEFLLIAICISMLSFFGIFAKNDNIEAITNSEGNTAIEPDVSAMKSTELVVMAIDYIPGDVNGDNVVTGKDVTLIRRYIAGGYNVTINEAAADVNDDGYITGKDVTLIRRYIAGGYGVELKPSTPKGFMVTFLDHDGTVLKTETNIESGAAAVAPADPARAGYRFVGWDITFDNVTEDLTVTAQYEIAENQVYISYTDNGDGTVTALFSLNGDVSVTSMEIWLQPDLTNASYNDCNAIVSTGWPSVSYTNNMIVFSYICDEILTAATDLFSVTFEVTADCSIAFTVTDSYVTEDYDTANISKPEFLGLSYTP